MNGDISINKAPFDFTQNEVSESFRETTGISCNVAHAPYAAVIDFIRFSDAIQIGDGVIFPRRHGFPAENVIAFVLENHIFVIRSMRESKDAVVYDHSTEDHAESLTIHAALMIYNAHLEMVEYPVNPEG